MKRIVAVVAVIMVVIFALIGCGPSAKDFQADDPNGYQACEAFGSAQGAGGNVYRTRIGLAADNGAKADSLKLRQAVRNTSAGAPVITDLSGFRKACKRAGYNF